MIDNCNGWFLCHVISMVKGFLKRLKSFCLLIVVFCCSELGVHVDGFIATVGHTVIVGSSVVSQVY